VRPLRVGIVSRTATYWPFYLAEHAGLFARHGLEIALVELGSTSAGVPALRDGWVDVAGTCPDAIVEAVGRGEDVRVGGGLADLPLGVLVAAPRIADLTGLRGARVAFTEARGSVSLFLRAALRARGLQPGDYEAVVRGTTPAQAEALRSGDVDAAMLTPPFDSRLVALGFRRLARVGTVLGRCAFTTLNVRRGWTAGAEWSRLGAALAEAGALLRAPEGRERAIAALAAATGFADDELDSAYRSLVVEDDAFATGVQLAPATLGNLLRLMREDGLDVPSDDPATYLDESAGPQLP